MAYEITCAQCSQTLVVEPTEAGGELGSWLELRPVRLEPVLFDGATLPTSASAQRFCSFACLDAWARARNESSGRRDASGPRPDAALAGLYLG